MNRGRCCYLAKSLYLAKISIVLASFILFACSSVNYQKAEDADIGYRDVQIDPLTHFVEYTEHASVPWEQVHQFVLTRCAEIAKNRGYKYFDVLEKEERELMVDSKVNQIQVVSGNAKWAQPSTDTYAMAGAKVKVKRVTYKIRMTNE